MKQARPRTADLSVVFSTRAIDPAFVDHVRTTADLKHIDILPYANPGRFSLAELYNKGLRKALSDIVVFVHDDVIFNRPNWGRALIGDFLQNDFGILGIAGTTDLVKDAQGKAERTDRKSKPP